MSVASPKHACADSIMNRERSSCDPCSWLLSWSGVGTNLLSWEKAFSILLSCGCFFSGEGGLGSAACDNVPMFVHKADWLGGR